MSTLYQRCLACICRRSRCRASALTGTREACRVVSVGQNWRLDCNKSLHSAAELVPGRSIDTVSFCGWAPCHAEAPLRIHILQYTLEQDGKLFVKIQNHKPKPSRTPTENVRIREVQHETKQRHKPVSQVRPYCPQQLHSGKLHKDPDHSLSTHTTKVSC